MHDHVERERTYFCPYQRRVRLCRREVGNRALRSAFNEHFESWRQAARTGTRLRSLIVQVSDPACELVNIHAE